LIRPSPFDDVTQPPKFAGGYNQVLVRYGEFVKELAGRNGASIADLNEGVVAALQKAYASDTNQAANLIADRVHPGPAGQLLMANELLKAWKAPALVSDVEIDASARKIIRSEGTKITALSASGALSWSQKDNALPMPLSTNDPVMAIAISSSDILQALDNEMLKVTGLKDDSYLLTIDGNKVGKLSREQLSHGINLALLPTPMAKQANYVHQLTLQHNDLHFTRWRPIQVPLADHKNPKIQNGAKSLMEGLDEEEAGVVAQQHQAAQPKAHQFDLTPSS
jgi:hypothetical protein